MEEFELFLVELCNLLKEEKEISFRNRQELYAKLQDIDGIVAYKIYKDLCHMYIVVVNDTKIDINQIERLTYLFDESFNANKFVRTFIDIGPLMDLLADCCEMNSLKRIEEWERQSTLRNIEIDEHQQNTNYYSRWSNFLFESRQLNKKAYEEIKTQKNGENNWQILLKEDMHYLEQKNPHFWSGLQVKSLTIKEKRAVVFKLSQIYSILPHYTRHLMIVLNEDIFQEENLQKSQSSNRKSRFKKLIIVFCKWVSFFSSD